MSHLAVLLFFVLALLPVSAWPAVQVNVSWEGTVAKFEAQWTRSYASLELCDQTLNHLAQADELGTLEIKSLNEWVSTWPEASLGNTSLCRDFPCDIKLSELEVAQLASKKPIAKILEERWNRFVLSGVKEASEVPGEPFDPVPSFEALAKDDWAKKSLPEKRVRILKVEGGDLKASPQLFARNVARTPHQVWRWWRDVVSMHYFERWVEADRGFCSDSGILSRNHWLWIEIDQLKKTDLFSVIGRPKIKASVEKLGQEYLKKIIEPKELVPGVVASPQVTPSPQTSATASPKPSATPPQALPTNKVGTRDGESG